MNITFINKKTGEHIDYANIIEINAGTHKDADKNGYSPNTIFYLVTARNNYGRHYEVTFPVDEYVIVPCFDYKN